MADHQTEQAATWECPDCGWFQQAHPRYGWASHDERAVQVHRSHLCPRLRLIPPGLGTSS